jgi:hypothetical protein
MGWPANLVLTSKPESACIRLFVVPDRSPGAGALAVPMPTQGKVNKPIQQNVPMNIAVVPRVIPPVIFVSLFGCE